MLEKLATMDACTRQEEHVLSRQLQVNSVLQVSTNAAKLSRGNLSCFHTV